MPKAMHSWIPSCLSLALLLSSPSSSFAQNRSLEHTFENQVHQYEAEARTTVDQFFKKPPKCSTQFKVQINPNGQVLAMTIDGSECSLSEQKKFSKQVLKMIFPRFKDLFLHHSKGQLPVLLIKITPNEETRVQCLWGAE
jgi:hypothetical protein